MQASHATAALQSLLITQTLRPDRVPAAAEAYVSAVLGEEFMVESEQEMDFAEIVERELKVWCHWQEIKIMSAA